MGTVIMTIASIICVILPTADFSRIEKIVLLIAIWAVITVFMTEWDGWKEEDREETDRRQQFGQFLSIITLPGKRHTLDIRSAAGEEDYG